jgi:CDP-glucose 4,6-dehydratase
MSLLADTYDARDVFLTGHTGFKGAWLAEWLTAMGASVTGYALDPPTDPNLFSGLDLVRRTRHVVADVRDRDRLVEEVQTAKPSVIFHLAARALVRRAYEEPRDTFETNVMGTANVLEAARSTSSVRAVVIVTSDKCYENLETGRPFRETDPLGGRDPYGASKACAELVTAAYRESFFAQGRNPDAIRPWQHVLEPLSGYLHLGARMLADGARYAGAWNFGPTDQGDEKPVRWVVDRFLREWGSGSWTTPSGREGQPHEAQRLSLDSAKAREHLRWAPVWEPATAVRRTASWYREYYRAPVSARDLVDDELQAYQEDARAAGLPWAISQDGTTNG